MQLLHYFSKSDNKSNHQHTYTNGFIYLYVSTYSCWLVCVCINVHLNICTCVRLRMCVCISRHSYWYVCLYQCTPEYTYIYKYMCQYTPEYIYMPVVISRYISEDIHAEKCVCVSVRVCVLPNVFMLMCMWWHALVALCIGLFCTALGWPAQHLFPPHPAGVGPFNLVSSHSTQMSQIWSFKSTSFTSNRICQISTHTDTHRERFCVRVCVVCVHVRVFARTWFAFVADHTGLKDIYTNVYIYVCVYSYICISTNVCIYANIHIFLWEQ